MIQLRLVQNRLLPLWDFLPPQTPPWDLTRERLSAAALSTPSVHPLWISPECSQDKARQVLLHSQVYQSPLSQRVAHLNREIDPHAPQRCHHLQLQTKAGI